LSIRQIEPDQAEGGKINMSRYSGRLTKPALRILAFAHEESEALGHASIDVEHLILGLAREPSNLGGRVLRELGLDLQIARRTFQNPDSGSETPAAELVLSPEVEAVLRSSLERAERLGHKEVGADYLFLALVDDSGGPGLDALHRLGIAPEQIQAQTKLVLEFPHPERAPLRVPEEKPLRCPRDDSLLASSFLIGVQVFPCPECDGIFIRKDSLERLYESVSAKTPRVFTTVSEAGTADVDPSVLCPNDEHSMASRTYVETEVEVCLDCGSVWLDRGEIEQVWGRWDAKSGLYAAPAKREKEPVDPKEILEIISEIRQFIVETIYEIAEWIIAFRRGR
jgi:ATP-dependent Clp protease ATP-binding subunit ClpC